VRKDAPQIPWHSGEVIFRRVAPFSAPDGGGGQIGAGRWNLSPRSTVPFVNVKLGKSGTRVLTWGEVVDVPDDERAGIASASFHQGDIILEATGTNASAPTRPACITIPANVVLVDDGGPTYRTGPLDVRMARRAYLAMPAGIAPAAPASVIYTVNHRGPERGNAFAPGTLAATSEGVLVDSVPLSTFGTLLPLGIGSGRFLDTLGRSFPEVRPMAFRDWLEVQLGQALGDAANFTPAADTLFVVEY